jgi:hypothetical protein
MEVTFIDVIMIVLAAWLFGYILLYFAGYRIVKKSPPANFAV